MKTIIKILGALAFMLVFNTTTSAQKNNDYIITTSFEVNGVCKMCKKRIENAALIKGVKFAEWDKYDQELKVIYDNRKTDLETIHQAVAERGHDTSKVKAPNEVYKKIA